MEYITHRRFKQTAICGSVNLRYGAKLLESGGMLMLHDGRLVCFASSENGHMYFALNDDGMGLERGSLTYAIAYAPRKDMKGYRFTEAERNLLTEKYNHWLRQDANTILFNNAFFAAPVDELRELAKKLNIKA